MIAASATGWLTNHLGWIDGWTRGRFGLELQTWRRDGVRWVKGPAPADGLMTPRVFEPAIQAFARHQTENLPFSVPDLSRLQPLMEPGELAGQLVPNARTTRHDIFVIEQPEGRIYLPAMLLIRALWATTARAAKALMIPNSVDLYVGRTIKRSSETAVPVARALASSHPSDLFLQRMAWLSQCEDARRSWGSVLTFAHQGKISLSLPTAQFSGWVWGIQLEAGLLACELMAPEVRFALPDLNRPLRIGHTVFASPPAPLFRKDPLAAPPGRT